MRKHLIVAGFAAATLIPSFAAAQTCEQQRNQRTMGTVAGAGIGALLGGAVAGKDDRTKGAVIGGLGGALLGNQISKSKADCANAYGYYDANGAWHANDVRRADARGYFDRSGEWVEGAPNGHYDSQGRWITASTDARAAGYYDRNGRWVPASASGYYDTSGQWVAGAAPGYYDSRGRWVAGPATGRYDADGRWIPGQAAGRRDANGVWIADAQPGYYDTNGRWRAGPAQGYYDTRGRWVATAPAAGGYGSNANYDDPRSDWRDAPTDFRERMAWIEQRIQRDTSRGVLTQREANRATRTLQSIRYDESRMPHRNGEVSRQNQVSLDARLDALTDTLRRQRQANRNQY